jgi:pimeloyl-ACP methyl ester carboxylesterase
MDLVLIHGMGRTPASMLRLRHRLRRAGHRAILFGYSPTFETLEGATARLLKTIARRTAGDYALVGHSLGSVIIRNALGRLSDRPPAACCFLAPPMVACKAARFFAQFWLYRGLMGEMGQLLADADFMARLPLPSVPTRVYAGTGGPRAAWLPFGMARNDVILSVAEATGRFDGTVVEVPAVHTFIMHSKRVAADIAGFLETVT